MRVTWRDKLVRGVMNGFGVEVWVKVVFLEGRGVCWCLSVGGRGKGKERVGRTGLRGRGGLLGD